MGIYLVERYIPDVCADDLRSLAGRLENASARLRAQGTPVQYLETAFAPGEDSCFCRFEAPSAEAAALVNRLADAPYARITLVVPLERSHAQPQPV